MKPNNLINHIKQNEITIKNTIMNAIFIELTDGSVYVARLEPTTASEDPLTDKDKVILDLHRHLERLKSEQNEILNNNNRR